MSISIPSTEEEYQALSWEDIARLSGQCAKNGSSDYEKLLGWSHDVTISDRIIGARLIGLNHNEFSDGSGKAGFTFQLWNNLNTISPFYCYLNAMNSGVASYHSIITSYIDELWKVFPKELVDLIKPVEVKTNSVGSHNQIETNSEELFLPALIEILGCPIVSTIADPDDIGDGGSSGTPGPLANPITEDCVIFPEGYQYEYFAQQGIRYATDTDQLALQKQVCSNTTYSYSALRTTSMYNGNNFYYLLSNGEHADSVRMAQAVLDVAFCLTSPPPPLYYLAGDWKGENNDQSQTLEWIDPDTDHKFYDETGNWSVIDNGPKVYSISYKGTCPSASEQDKKQHDHSNCFQNPPTEAAVGDTVTVKLKNINGTYMWTFGGKTSYVGITDASITDLGTDSPPTLLEQTMPIDKDSWSELTYTFIMPAHDVTVWIWCVITADHPE